MIISLPFHALRLERGQEATGYILARDLRLRECQPFRLQPVLKMLPVLPSSLLIEFVRRFLDPRPKVSGLRTVAVGM